MAFDCEIEMNFILGNFGIFQYWKNGKKPNLLAYF